MARPKLSNRKAIQERLSVASKLKASGWTYAQLAEYFQMTVRSAQSMFRPKNVSNSGMCSKCKTASDHLHRHHPDYTKPSEVVLLCGSCHGKEQRDLRDKVKPLLLSGHTPIQIMELVPGVCRSSISKERRSIGLPPFPNSGPNWYKNGTRKPGEDNPEIDCACGCGIKILKYDSRGRPQTFAYRHSATRGDNYPRAKLNEEKVREIRSLFGQLTISQLARKYDVGWDTVKRIVTRQRWAHVQ